MSIENPRQEADTPRVPELSWSPSKREVYWLPDPTATNVWTLELVDESLPSDELPADAVKLGNVEDMRALLDQTVQAEMVAKQQLAEISAVLRDWSEHDEIRAILDREPGREEPEEGSPSAIAAEELAALTRPKATARRVLHNWTVPDHLMVQDTGEYARLVCLQHLPEEVASGWYSWDERLIAFLQEHSHGHVVEHQPASAEWRCARCGADRWVGWRAGPAHEGYPRKAQCVSCGIVQELPVVEHQPAQDSETEQQLQLRVGREQFAGAQRRIATLEADRERIYSELARMRAERDQLKARTDEALTYIPEPGQGGWDLSPDRLDALLQKIRRALLGQPYTDAASAAPVAKETGEEADQ